MNTPAMKTTIVVLAVVIVVLLGILFFYNPAQSPTLPSSHQSSTVAMSSDGHVAVSLPQANALVSSPLAIEGTVTGGGWFFEASFPVKVLDGDGKVIGQAPAQALGDWMSTGTVPFSASIPFTAPKYATGTLVLAKDNPSGLPQNALELRIPIRFK